MVRFRLRLLLVSDGGVFLGEAAAHPSGEVENGKAPAEGKGRTRDFFTSLTVLVLIIDVG
jgi:hypothetical protein